MGTVLLHWNNVQGGCSRKDGGIAESEAQGSALA